MFSINTDAYISGGKLWNRTAYQQYLGRVEAERQQIDDGFNNNTNGYGVHVDTYQHGDSIPTPAMTASPRRTESMKKARSALGDQTWTRQSRSNIRNGFAPENIRDYHRGSVCDNDDEVEGDRDVSSVCDAPR